MFVVGVMSVAAIVVTRIINQTVIYVQTAKITHHFVLNVIYQTAVEHIRFVWIMILTWRDDGL
jgi:hypothetical protein